MRFYRRRPEKLKEGSFINAMLQELTPSCASLPLAAQLCHGTGAWPLSLFARTTAEALPAHRLIGSSACFGKPHGVAITAVQRERFLVRFDEQAGEVDHAKIIG